MNTLFWILLSFLCGSFPFSIWLGRLFMGVDVRQFGDGNPGSSNVFRAGNKIAGILALILDISKAAVPVGLAYFNFNIRGLPMFLIASAPVLGHVFSPFLFFKGGKALATVLGVWIGLTIWKVSLAAVIPAIIGVSIITPVGWVIMGTLAVMLAAILIWIPDPLLISIWFMQVLILLWTHRLDLQQPIQIRPWLKRIMIRNRN